MKKRVLAALMTACMVVGSVPGVSLADATTDNSGTSYTLDGVETTDSAETAITLKKEAEPAGDGIYDITLTVDATKAKDQIQVKPTERLHLCWMHPDLWLSLIHISQTY